MARSLLRQEAQIAQSRTFDDTFTMANAESSPVSLEDDLNYLRTQLRIISGETNWFDAITDTFNIKAIHDKRLTYWKQKTDDVTVGAATNVVSLTGATKPGSDNIAIGATALGAIVAQLVGAIGSHDLTAATNNGNIVEVRDATTNDEIFDGTDKVFGLLQVGNLATDGNAFGDTGNDQAQISFVTINPSTEALQAASTAVMGNKVIEYAFRVRTDFFNLPENAFDTQVTFVENEPLASVDLQDVYDNDAAGDVLLTAAKNFTVNMNSNADFEVVDGATSFILADQSGVVVRMGVPLEILNGNETRYYDSGSSNFIGFSAPALTANVSYVWPALDGNDGDVLKTDGAGNLAWVDNEVGTKKITWVLGADILANNDIAIASFDVDNDGMVFPATAAEWVDNFDVYLNGQLLLNGESAVANNDVYYQSTTAFRAEFDLKGGGGNPDILQVIQRKVGA